MNINDRSKGHARTEGLRTDRRTEGERNRVDGMREPENKQCVYEYMIHLLQQLKINF